MILSEGACDIDNHNKIKAATNNPNDTTWGNNNGCIRDKTTNDKQSTATNTFC